MDEFINRFREQLFLDGLIEQSGAQFIMLYGRRRIGKTTLLVHWARKTGLPFFYWVAKQDPRERLMADLARSIYAWQHNITPPEIQVRDWETVFQMLKNAIGDKQAIIVLDELPYVLQEDPGFASHLQAAWDQQLKQTNALIFLSGSHIGMLTELTRYRAPLYGRLTNQIPLLPLSFEDMQPFLPRYDIYKRLSVYAILGGVPAYLERWQDTLSVAENVDALFFQRTGWFRNEPDILVSDLTQRETRNYEIILKVIAQGHHTREEIASYTAIPSTSLSHYLPRLIEMQLVERRIPAMTPLSQLSKSKQARYHLRDPFLRFYYRFIDPNLHLIETGLTKTLWQSFNVQFKAHVGLAFEEFCREWVKEQASIERLRFQPENIGSHWSSGVQVDVMAISWQEKYLLLGECKWTDQAVGRAVIDDLLYQKTPKVLASLPDKGAGWRIQYMLFYRHSCTATVVEIAEQHDVRLVPLAEMIW